MQVAATASARPGSGRLGRQSPAENIDAEHVVQSPICGLARPENQGSKPPCPSNGHNGQDGRPWNPQVEGSGRSRATQHLKPTGADARDRIVDRPHDRPIVHQQGVGDRAEALLGVFGRNGHRFFGKISAGTNHGPLEGSHEQVMKGRVGEHDAQVRIARGDGIGNVCRRIDFATEQHDRRLWGDKRAGFFVGDLAAALDFVERRIMTANGLSGRCFRSRNRRTAFGEVA